MKQIAVRIGGFVVNAGSQTIVLDRNVDVEKSNARSGNFPGKFESRMTSIDKFPAQRTPPKSPIISTALPAMSSTAYAAPPVTSFTSAKQDEG